MNKLPIYGMILQGAAAGPYTVPLGNPLVLVGNCGNIRNVFVPPTL